MKLWWQFLKKTQDSTYLNQFLALLAFEITFVIVRVITHLQRAGILPNQEGSLHVHHLVPGIILLLLSGYLMLVFSWTKKTSRLAAVLFGIGAALTLDEFALWLNLSDVYWQKQGRESIDAIVIFSVLLLISLLVGGFYQSNWWKNLTERVRSTFRL
jgi:hypothetical protein